jgi:hypothetical protein
MEESILNLKKAVVSPGRIEPKSRHLLQSNLYHLHLWLIVSLVIPLNVYALSCAYYLSAGSSGLGEKD